MAGPLSQAESDVVARRLINVATAMRDAAEEIARLESENTTFNFSANLDEPSFGGVTKAELLAFVTGPMFGFRDFWNNETIAFDGSSGSSDRRDKINPLLLTEPLS